MHPKTLKKATFPPIFLLFTCMLPLLFSFGGRPAFYEVFEQLKANSPKAENLLVDFQKANPSHALANYYLGMLYLEKMKTTPWHSPDNVYLQKRDSTLKLIEMASATLQKKEIKKYKGIYEELLAIPRPQVAQAQRFFGQQLQEVKDLDQKIGQLKILSGQLAEAYTTAETAYLRLKQGYNGKYAAMLLHDTQALLPDFEAISQATEKLRSIVEKHEALKTNPHLAHQVQNVHLQKFERFRASPIPESQFSHANIYLFDYHLWLEENLKLLANEVEIVKNGIALTNGRLDNYLAVLGSKASFANSLSFETEQQFIDKLNAFDPGSLVARVLHYKKMKTAYLLLEKSFQDIKTNGKFRASVVLSGQKSLLSNLEQCRATLREIAAPNALALQKHYQFYFDKNYGGQAGWERFLDREVAFWNNEENKYQLAYPEELLSGSNFGHIMPDKTLPDNSFENLSLHRLGISSILNIQEQVPLSNGDVLIAGTCRGFNGSDVFLARISNTQAGIWARRFVHQPPAAAEALQFFTASSKGLLAFALASAKTPTGNSALFRIIAMDLEGNLLQDQPLAKHQVLKSLTWAEDGQQLLVVGQEGGEKNLDSQKLFFTRMYANGKTLSSDGLSLVGHFAGMQEMDAGFVLVANFQAFEDEQGQWQQGKASNVLIAIFDKEGQLNNIFPIFSDSELIANQVARNEYGQLVIEGLQRHQNDTQATAQDWRYVLD